MDCFVASLLAMTRKLIHHLGHRLAACGRIRIAAEILRPQRAFGEKEAAQSIVGAIERTLGERTLRTRDLGGNADTTACGKAVADMVD